MKALRMLVITLFLLAAVMTSAGAQGPNASTTAGYIPLLTQVDPNLPIEMQTEAALRAVIPQLLAAQQSGDILAFEPELSFGILKIQYRTRFDTAQLKAGNVYSGINAAVARVPLSEFLNRESVSGVVPNVTAPFFSLYLYSSCFSASGLPASSRVVGNLKDKNGRVVANYEGYTDGSGNLNSCFDSNGPYADVIPAYLVTFAIYDASDNQVGYYYTHAPAITFTTITKASSKVKGTGPANKTFDISWEHNKLDSTGTWSEVVKTGTNSKTGTWSVAFGTTSFRGDDYFNYTSHQTANFDFHRTMTAPYAYCQLGGNYCYITGFAFKHASLSIVHGGVTHNLTDIFDAGGYFYAYWTNIDGGPIFLKVGDKVYGTGVAQYTLPNMTITVNFDTNVVSGKLPSNKYFYLAVYNLVPKNVYHWWMLSDSSGYFSQDTTSTVDLKQNKATTVESQYQNPNTGNITDLYVSFAP